MVFGFLKGKIELSLDKRTFSPGEKIRGSVSLKLKKPVHASKIAVRFRGVKKSTSGVGKSRRTTSTTIHDYTLELDGEKDYTKGDYTFEISIPGNILSQTPQLEGVLGSVAKVAQTLGGLTERLRWYIQAYLDIPKSTDIRKTVEINITEITGTVIRD